MCGMPPQCAHAKHTRRHVSLGLGPLACKVEAALAKVLCVGLRHLLLRRLGVVNLQALQRAQSRDELAAVFNAAISK